MNAFNILSMSTLLSTFCDTDNSRTVEAMVGAVGGKVCVNEDETMLVIAENGNSDTFESMRAAIDFCLVNRKNMTEKDVFIEELEQKGGMVTEECEYGIFIEDKENNQYLLRDFRNKEELVKVL